MKHIFRSLVRAGRVYGDMVHPLVSRGWEGHGTLSGEAGEICALLVLSPHERLSLSHKAGRPLGTRPISLPHSFVLVSVLLL